MISERQARIYCYQDISLIENYELAIADKTQTWHCHHRVETIMNCSAEELIAQGCYKDRPAHDLIFLPPGEHSRLHNTGKKLSEKTRAKMSAAVSAAVSGENNPMFGKHLSEEHRAKISAAVSAAVSGVNHPMFGKHHSKETRAKMSAAVSAAKKGAHWFNNGVESRCCKECPGDGWQRGRL